ncbi:hypothetical protein TNIN_291261 [Trichonephila inaurata madagascariensis]|uniref:Uncharacterized protein n=1 Tax=Trichonephila inaurata madagascariensis TaxID=2747483 RepID=A0A8X7BP13_9ARAC|nr:hypothetical protein TNIN_291261 [Trichonephila inaurata madagascariensis]
MSNVNVTLAMNGSAHDTTKVLPLQINYIPEFVTKTAEEEFNDSPENRRKGLEQLKELLNVLSLQINYIPEFITKMAEEEFNDSPENRRKEL